MADSLTQPGPHIRDLPQGAPSLASLVPEELAPPPDGVAALLLIAATIAVFTYVYLGTRDATPDWEAPVPLTDAVCWLGISAVGAGIFLLTKGPARRLWPTPAWSRAKRRRRAMLTFRGSENQPKGKLIAGLTPFPLVM